ncbi:TonB-dependent receptor [Gilvimarinus sp. F26214L]|uniref:TonB-dependent receptor n=1 Tax=Gilvimarinus sp. DZF01 TaxID=3461371 RepID=UPI0040465A60
MTDDRSELGRGLGAMAVAMLGLGPVGAAAADGRESAPAIDEIIVYDHSRRSSLHLEENTGVGGRLGLSVFELPASVDVIDQESMARRGDYDVLSTVTRSTGMVSSASPGNGGSSVSARGFGGHGSVVTSYDGNRLYVGAGSVTFPTDTWLLERVEVLRGPGSVIHGIGATGATINYLPRAPRFGDSEMSALVSSGSYGARRVGLGAGGQLSDTLAYRVDGIHHRKDGYVERAEEQRDAAAASVLYRPSEDLSVKVSMDYADVEAAPYFGTPLINGRASERMRKSNYNVRDALVEYRDLWPRVQLEWRLSDTVSFRHNSYYMDAERHWRNLETYAYNEASGAVDRSFYLEILHDQEQVGSRSDLLFDFDLAGMENKLTVGVEFNQSDFAHYNNSPYGGESRVPVTGFEPGYFLPVDETTLDYVTDLGQYAVFFDDVLNITERWSVVIGGRYDRVDFERADRARSNGQAAGFFDAGFSELSWRLGTVYRLQDSLSLYAQYSTSPDAIGSLASLNVDAQELDLTEAEQFEVGAKYGFWGGRGESTVALYSIRKRNLFTQEVMGGPVEQIGEQSSRGVELGFGLRPVDALALSLNLAWTDAEFDDFAGLSGNTPPHVPEWTANLWADWSFAPGWEAGAGLRYVDERYSSNSNAEQLPAYTVLDASVHWQASDSVTAFARGRNLNNEKDYVLSSYGASQWLFAEPRAFEVGFEMRF